MFENDGNLRNLFNTHLFEIFAEQEAAERKKNVQTINLYLNRPIDEQWDSSKTTRHPDALIGSLYVNESVLPESNIFSYFSNEIKELVKEKGIDQYIANHIIKVFNAYTFESNPELRHKYYTSMGHLQNLISIAKGEQPTFFKYREMKKEFEIIKANLPNIGSEETLKDIQNSMDYMNATIKIYKDLIQFQITEIKNGEFKKALGTNKNNNKQYTSPTTRDLKKLQLEAIAKEGYQTQLELVTAINIERDRIKYKPFEDQL